MGRAPCCDKANVKRGPWSPEEDAILKNFVERHGTGGNWIALPHKAGLRRCGKSCRLRWLNYLRPDIKHGGFSEEEDNIICSLYSSIGSRWSIIAAQLPGRTDNDIKNYWNTRLKKKLLGKSGKDDEQTRRFLAKEAAAANEIRMRYGSSNANINNASEANISASNSSSSESLSVTDPVQQSLKLNSPYALDSSNVSILFQDPSSSAASAESPLPKTGGFHVNTDNYERAFKQISDYSSFTSILMKALESNNRTECSSVSSHISPPIMNPCEAQEGPLYAEKLVNIKDEINDSHHHPLSMPLWETSTSSGLWMGDVNNSQEYPNISSGDPINELFYFNNSMPMKEESIYGITNPDSAAYWVSHLSANSVSDQKSSYSYILLPEGNSKSNTNTTSQEIFQEGIIY